jgi:hypothetical protein
LFIHGQATREPLWNKTDVLDEAANLFIPDNDISKLTYEEQTRARNLTSAIYSIPVTDIPLSFVFSANGSDVATVDFPYKTDSRGEFNQFVSTKIDGVTSDGTVVQRLDVHSNVSDGTPFFNLSSESGKLTFAQLETAVHSLCHQRD